MACLADWPELQLLWFELVTWARFFFPGLEYYRLRRREEATARLDGATLTDTALLFDEPRPIHQPPSSISPRISGRPPKETTNP